MTYDTAMFADAIAPTSGVAAPVPAPAAPARWAPKRLVGRASWAVADQGAFSLSNWLLQVMLANWLPSERDYGTFVVAFGWFLLVGMVHNALMIEPMLVFGPDRYRDRLGRYFGALVASSAAVAVLGGGVLAAIGAAYAALGQGGVGLALWALAAATPCVMLSWLMRRASYVRMEPRLAATAGLGYLASMAGGLSLLHAAGHFTVPSAVAVMAACSLAAGLWLARREGVVRPGGPRDATLRAATGDHWRYGRWAVLSGAMIMGPEQLWYFVLPAVEGYVASGSLRALVNLFQPFTQLNIALCSLMLPLFVRTWGTPDFLRVRRLALLGLTVAPGLFWLFCGLFHGEVIGLLYRGRYLDVAPLVWILGLQPVAAGVTAVMHTTLACRQRPDRIFVGSACGAGASLALGALLIRPWGLEGVMIANLASVAVNGAVAWHFARRVLDGRDAGGGGSGGGESSGIESGGVGSVDVAG